MLVLYLPESIWDLRENMLRGVFLISVSLKAKFYKSQFTYLNSEVTFSNAMKRQQSVLSGGINTTTTLYYLWLLNINSTHRLCQRHGKNLWILWSEVIKSIHLFFKRPIRDWTVLFYLLWFFCRLTVNQSLI